MNLSTSSASATRLSASLNDEIAVLLGNGLSIAYNRDLAIPSLTKAIEERFNDSAGMKTEASAKLAGLVHDQPRADALGDFEALLGPLDEIAELGPKLERVASLVHDPATAISSIKQMQAAMDEVRRAGVSHVLELIGERAYPAGDGTGVVEDFLKAIFAASRGQAITVANLNYDNLVASSLLRLDADMCDMARGSWTPPTFVVGNPGVPATAFKLRTSADFFPAQVQLLHLHGSLAWLRSPEGLVYKFEMDDLRASDYWRCWREGKSDWAPEVVLTNQSAKTNLVRRHPFSLGYDQFGRRLLSSDRWLIAGYSFRDECVNKMLGQAFWTRLLIGVPPQILVVTHGRELAKTTVLRAVGYDKDRGDPEPSRWLRISRRGIPDAVHGPAWGAWSAEASASSTAA